MTYLDFPADLGRYSECCSHGAAGLINDYQEAGVEAGIACVVLRMMVI